MQTVAKRLNPMQHVATRLQQLSPRSWRDMRMLANSIDTRVAICRASEDARGHEAAAWRRFPHQDGWPATSRSQLRCCLVHRHPGARSRSLPFVPPATPPSRADPSKYGDGGQRVVCSCKPGYSASLLTGSSRRRKSARAAAERPVRVGNDAAAGLISAPDRAVGTSINLPRGFQP
jgi:hypothetical protein